MEKYFYSFDDDELNPDYDSIENYLSKVETSISRILNDLCHRKLNFRKKRQRILFARFICFLHYRTVQARDYFRILLQNTMKLHFVDEINNSGGYLEWVKQRPNLNDISEKDFLDSFNALKLKTNKTLSIVSMWEAAFKMIPFLVERNWNFYIPESNDDLFITSDSPVVLYNKDLSPDMVPGFALQETIFVFPVNSRLCFVASFSCEEGYVTVPTDIVVRINKLIANKSHKYVFGSSNDFRRLFGDM